MSELVDIRVIERLAARLCHELVGPVAAVGNGAELLAEEDAAFVREAAGLVGNSARQAAARLQFYRFAYGFGAGGALTGPPPHELAGALFAATRVACEYRAAVRELPLEWQKLACNLAALAADAMPRGGRLVIDAGRDGLWIEGRGDGAALAAETRAALALQTSAEALTSRTVQPYFTALLARSLGRRLCDGAAAGGGFRVFTAAG